jgi:hypothetical protein
MMLVAQLLFTLLEVARYRESAKVMQMSTERGIESAFADYCSPLWENYRLLGMTAADGEGNFSFNQREAAFRELSGTAAAGVDFLAAEVSDVEFSDYLLLTDEGGKVFEETVCAYMKQNLGYEAARTLYSRYEAVKNAEENYEGTDAAIQNAQDALNNQSDAGSNLKGAAIRDSEETQTAETASAENADNPLTAIAEVKKKGVFALVLPESATLSSNALTLKKTVSHRTLTSGTKTETIQTDWYQTVLFDQYLEQYLSCYTETKEDRALSYELEYLIGGKAADADNLRVVVKELLAVREALNMVTLLASSAKQAEALALATAIAGASVNPLVIEGVKYGILAAWAFVESVMDLRTLLSGGKIALGKSKSEWTSNVNALPALLSGWSQANSSEQGLSYREYLGMLLLFHSGETLAMRAMDVQEAAIQRVEGYSSFQMDHVVCETKLVVTYEYKPIFMGFVNLLKSKPDAFRIQRTAEYSYRSGKEGT